LALLFNPNSRPLPPRRPTPLGRGPDLERARRALDEARVVGISGPPGAGKSRLALELAWRARDGAALDRVYWCDLAGAYGALRMARAIALGVGAQLRGAQTEGHLAQLAALLERRGPSLLVLDGLPDDDLEEHLEDLAGRTPGLSILVTSRHPLPPPARDLRLAPLALEDGLQLFAARAGVPLTASRRPVLSELVAALDGSPLAIELVAARHWLLPPCALLSHLEPRVQLLGALVGFERRALRAVIDWTWDLLELWERAATSQLSICSQPFDGHEARAVLDLSPFPGAPAPALALETLTRHALLEVIDTGAGRYRLHPALREYASEQLPTAARDAAVARRARMVPRL
jgi:predicted ATPase